MADVEESTVKKIVKIGKNTSWKNVQMKNSRIICHFVTQNFVGKTFLLEFFWPNFCFDNFCVQAQNASPTAISVVLEVCTGTCVTFSLLRVFDWYQLFWKYAQGLASLFTLLRVFDWFVCYTIGVFQISVSTNFHNTDGRKRDSSAATKQISKTLSYTTKIKSNF